MSFYKSNEVVHLSDSQNQASGERDISYPPINSPNKHSSASPTPAPWEEGVNGETLFSELTQVFRKYLALQEKQAEALALWAIFSHSFNASNIAPKLLIHSPEKRCGKTTLLDVLTGLVCNPISASNITPAVLFRVIDSKKGTIMMDEADTFIRNDSEISGIINSGHRKSQAFVWRCVGDAHEPTAFSTWAPTVIAMIGKPADTIVDRSILITMRRKRPDETVERFMQHKAEIELNVLKRKIMRWVQDNFEDLCDIDPDVPEGLNDRAQDNWRPLLSIAELIGPDCASKAREAAFQLSRNEEDEDGSSTSTQLLNDIRDFFETNPQATVPTRLLLSYLHDLEDRPWSEWNRGRAMTSAQLVKHLGPFRIKPRKMRSGQDTFRGYERNQFEDAFSRYLRETLNQNCSDEPNGTDAVPEAENPNHLKLNGCSVVPANRPSSEITFSKWDEIFG